MNHGNSREEENDKCDTVTYSFLGNQYFWCDLYGLNDFVATFDIFGGSAPLAKRKTWKIRRAGLFMDELDEAVQEWYE